MIIALREGRGLLTQRNSLRNLNTKTYTESRCKQKSPRPWDIKVKFLHLWLVSPSLAEDAIHMEEGLEKGMWARRAKGEWCRGRASPLPPLFLDGKSTTTAQASKCQIGEAGILPPSLSTVLTVHQRKGNKTTGLTQWYHVPDSTIRNTQQVVPILKFTYLTVLLCKYCNESFFQNSTLIFKNTSCSKVSTGAWHTIKLFTPKHKKAASPLCSIKAIYE